jgi:hypothetical protein
MQKQKQPCVVQIVTLGEREGFSHKRAPSLAQRVVPALHLCRLARLFAHRPVLVLGDDALIRCPEVRVAGGFAPRGRHLLPQKTAALFTAVAQAAGDPLARAAVERYPPPDRLFLRAHKGPEFVPLQHGRRAGGGWSQGAAQGRESGGFLGANG